jgi:hypothetical protein
MFVAFRGGKKVNRGGSFKNSDDLKNFAEYSFSLNKKDTNDCLYHSIDTGNHKFLCQLFAVTDKFKESGRSRITSNMASLEFKFLKKSTRPTK